MTLFSLIIFSAFLNFWAPDVKSNIAIQDDEIHWEEGARLVWDDFKGKPDKRSPFMAASMCSMGYSSAYDESGLSTTVTCTFDRRRSWVKEDKATEVLLNHEQQHFNLTELYARHLRKKISETSFTPDNLQKKLRKLYHEVYAAYRARQQAYDEETNHGTIEETQLKWDKKIWEELEELKAFSASAAR